VSNFLFPRQFDLQDRARQVLQIPALTLIWRCFYLHKAVIVGITSARKCYELTTEPTGILVRESESYVELKASEAKHDTQRV
jgi:hypothetical protein